MSRGDALLKFFKNPPRVDVWHSDEKPMKCFKTRNFFYRQELPTHLGFKKSEKLTNAVF